MGLAAGLVPVLARAGTGAQEQQVLRFAMGQSWAAPYVELDGQTPVGGLMFELMQAIAREAGARAEFVLLPSMRVDAALDTGEVDLHCLISPLWYSQPLDPDRLGPPMVILEDVLAARAGTAPLDLAAQRGLRVGTVLGYRYGELDPLFADGRLVREDAPNQQRLLEKLSRGRSAVAVVDRLVLAAYNRGIPAGERLSVLRSLSRTPTHCMLGKRADLPVKQVRAALERLVARGDVRRLMARYR